MKTIDYLTELKKNKNLKSNYAAAKYLGLTQTTLSKYQNGKGFFSDEVAIRIADELDINCGIVLADIHAEREQDPNIKKMWLQVARQLQQSAAAVFLVALAALSTDNAEAGAINQAYCTNFLTLPSIYYANLKGWLKSLFKKRSNRNPTGLVFA